MTEIKLTKRYPHSRTEDITVAFMRGYQQGKEDEHRWWSNFCANCKDADRKTESDSEKPNNFDKDINVRSKTEPQTERRCNNCKYYGGGEVCDHPSIGEVEMGGKGDTFPWIEETPIWCPLTDEPQTDCSWK